MSEQAVAVQWTDEVAGVVTVYTDGRVRAQRETGGLMFALTRELIRLHALARDLAEALETARIEHGRGRA